MAFKGIRLPIPSAMSEYNFSIDEFKGIDKASGEDNFSPHRAVSAQNFIRDKIGRVKKRGGFTQDSNVEGKIEWTGRWCDFDILCICNANEKKTVFFKKDGIQKIILSDVDLAHGFIHGEVYYLLYVKSDTNYVGRFSTSGEEIISVSVPLDANLQSRGMKITTPVITENARPAGGGSLLCSPNMLSPFVTETFTVTENDLSGDECKRFQLSMQNVSLHYNGSFISSDTWMTQGTYWTMNGNYRELTAVGAAALQNSVRIEKYVSIGDAEQMECEWQTVDLTEVFKENGRNFMNTESAALWIPAANIGVSPVEGQPNVRITYIRNHEEYLEDVEKVCACTQSVCFGVGGHKDRVFLAGGNRIYYSGMDDPLYFGELCYVEPCSADKEIMALGTQGQYLYAVDSDGITHVITGTVTEDDANTYMSEAAFVIADRVQGEKPTIRSNLKIFGEEFCYISEEGLVAIRHDNFYDKRYAQNRSRLLGDSIKGKIKDAAVWGNFLVLATATELYLLDELQQTTLPDYKYSGKQYEIFPFTFSVDGFEIQNVWTDYRDNLQLVVYREGTDTREVWVYDEDKSNDIAGYSITAEWISPPLALSSPRYCKLIHHLHLSLGTNDSGSAVKVEYRTDYSADQADLNTGWKTLREADGRFIPFNYGSLNYAMFNYGGILPKLQLIIKRRPAKYFRKIQFRFTSAREYALSLADFGFTYEKEVI